MKVTHGCGSLFALLTVLGPAAVQSGGCLGTCQDIQAKGACSTSFLIASSGNGLDAARSALGYGRYCGNSRQCDVGTEIPAGQEDSVCVVNATNSTVDVCPPAPCDGVDQACMMHNTCLDTVGDTAADRCACDVQMVASLAAVAENSTAPTFLCDSAFYNMSIPGTNVTPIELVRHESVLMAVSFCCNILTPTCDVDATAKNYSSAYGVASAFCALVLQELKEENIDLCGPDAGFPACYVCGTNTKGVLGRDTSLDPLLPATCGQVEDAGLSGFIPESSCDDIQENLQIIDFLCTCRDLPGVTALPTEVPPTTSMPTVVPATTSPTSSDGVCLQATTMTTSMMICAAGAILMAARSTFY